MNIERNRRGGNPETANRSSNFSDTIDLTAVSEEKALIFLEAGMAAFDKSGQRDIAALKLIISSLLNAPLYIPVQLDVEAILGNVDLTALKKGDTIQSKRDSSFRFLELPLPDGSTIVPLFTSAEEARKRQPTHLLRCYPQEYLPIVSEMGKECVLNPFGEHGFVIVRNLINDILLPAMEKKADHEKQKAPVPPDGLLGREIGERYMIAQHIGGTGASEVYLAHDKKTGGQWAVKAYRKTQNGHDNWTDAQIRQEAHIMGELHHPGIPEIADFLEDDDYFYIVREYIEGEALKSILEKSGAQPVEKVVAWSMELCEILQYLHTPPQMYVHRDVKPGNIVITREGQAKLIDFSITRIYDPHKTEDEMLLGTRGYAAPEQHGGKGQTDARTDVYGLGMTMHQMLTGINPIKVPYDAQSMKKSTAALPKGLAYIVAKCIENEPAMRYQSCAAVEDDLKNYRNLPHRTRGFKLFHR